MGQINPNKIVADGIVRMNNNSQIQQVGIDLSTISDFTLEHGMSINITLADLIRLPDDIYATFQQRSSYSRKGIFMTTGVYDPGYEGTIGCTVYNMSGDTIKVERGSRIGQMLFFEADAASSYNGQWQGK